VATGKAWMLYMYIAKAKTAVFLDCCYLLLNIAFSLRTWCCHT